MHEKKDISDKIEELFKIDNSHFDPKVHFPLADEVIAALKPKSYILRWHDLLEFDHPISGKKLEAERERIGHYVSKPVGRLPAALFLGFYPKIEIINWKDRLFDNDAREELFIAYQGSKSVGIMKSINDAYSISIPIGKGSYTFLYQQPRVLWTFER